MSVSTRTKPAKEPPAPPTPRCVSTTRSRKQKEPFDTVRARQGRHLPLRPDGLRQSPHRPHGRPGDLRLHQALPHLLRLQGQLGRQHHRRRRQADQEGQRARHLDARRRRRKHRRLQRATSPRSASIRSTTSRARPTACPRSSSSSSASSSSGVAYESDGDVYFDVGKDADYGKLSNRSIESLQGEGGSDRRTQNDTPPTSPSGNPPSPASPPGKAPGATAGPAGTSNAPP